MSGDGFRIYRQKSFSILRLADTSPSLCASKSFELRQGNCKRSHWRGRASDSAKGDFFLSPTTQPRLVSSVWPIILAHGDFPKSLHRSYPFSFPVPKNLVSTVLPLTWPNCLANFGLTTMSCKCIGPQQHELCSTFLLLLTLVFLLQ